MGRISRAVTEPRSLTHTEAIKDPSRVSYVPYSLKQS